MHPSYQSLIVNQVARVAESARALQSIHHSGLKGQLRELIVQELIEPLLPPGCVSGSGEIVTAYGGTSNQIDIVVADRRILPPVLIRGAGIFPLEACLLTIEIKSVLNAGELRISDASTKKVSKFRHAPQVGFSQPSEKPIEHVIPFLLAFSSDLAPGGKSEPERYKEITGDEPPAIRAFCVVGRGYWYWNNGIWCDGALAVEHGDLVGLIGDIINVAQRVSATRQQPDVREYLVWNNPLVRDE